MYPTSFHDLLKARKDTQSKLVESVVEIVGVGCATCAFYPCKASRIVGHQKI